MIKVCATNNGWVTVCGTGEDATDWFLAKSIGHITAGSRRNRRIAWSFQDVGTSRASSSRDGLIVYNNIAPINVRGFGYNHIAVRSAKTGELIYQLRGQKTQITGLALANGGRQVVSGDDKGTIRVWDLPPMAGRSESSTVPQP
jgi:WD40 repeat protein